jgi:hypothetical protein
MATRLCNDAVMLYRDLLRQEAKLETADRKVMQVVGTLSADEMVDYVAMTSELDTAFAEYTQAALDGGFADSTLRQMLLRLGRVGLDDGLKR